MDGGLRWFTVGIFHLSGTDIVRLFLLPPLVPLLFLKLLFKDSKTCFHTAHMGDIWGMLLLWQSYEQVAPG